MILVVVERGNSVGGGVNVARCGYSLIAAIVAWTHNTVIIRRHETHVMLINAVELVWSQAKFIPWLRLGSVIHTIVMVLIVYHCGCHITLSSKIAMSSTYRIRH